jgi:hypothetical protein
MTPSLRKTARVIAAGIVFFSLTAVALAQGDQVAIGRTITVAPGETRGDIACLHCSVYVRGAVKGDIAVLWGRVVIEGTVTGDVALIGGDLRIGDGAQVGGDVAIVGGQLKKSPSAAVRGEQASFTRRQLIVGTIFALACMGVVIALFVLLMVWLFRRRRAVPAQQVVRRA